MAKLIEIVKRAKYNATIEAILKNIGESKMVKIEILGTGCAKCKSLLKNVEKAVQESGIQAEVVKVDSIQEIMDRGVMMTPALYIDGKSIMVGRTATVEEIKKMLTK
jgi:small redox-active disulfide protein 2